jgi:OmcA/MtrC family decaheme c-type cytochrome
MKTKQWKKVSIIISFLALAAIALSGCSSGDDGAAGAAGATGATGATGPAGPAGPAAGTDASKMTVPEVSAVINSATVTIDSVTIAGKPVVNFTAKDAKGDGITGLGARNTSTPSGVKNFRIGIAKLVPGTNGSPSKWVNYIVTSAATPPVAVQPTTDSQGTLVDHGDGSYTYTFYRDLATIKDTAGVTDVTYEPTLTHRLVVALTNGDDPEPPDIFLKSQNAIYEFTIDPTTKAAVPLTATSTRRDIVTTAKCEKCHGYLAKMFGHGYKNTDGGHFDTRPDVRNCITCHTDQMRINPLTLASVNYVFPARPAGENRRLSPIILDGEVVLDFPIMIHKMHMGDRLAKTGYNADGILFNEKVYPQDITNCRACHSGDTAAELAAAPQGNNWKDKPSRLACGSCHDGINWATGAGKTVAGATTGHIGGAAANDSLCYVCHTAVAIDTVYHQIKTDPTSSPNIPAGASRIEYEIFKVTVNGSNQPVVTFRILKDGSPVSFNAYTGTTDAEAATYYLTGLLTGFKGGPAFLVAYSTTGGVDYDNIGNGAVSTSLGQPVRVYISDLKTGKGGSIAASTVSGAPTGSYDAVLTTGNAHSSSTGAITAGTSVAVTFPAASKLRTVALQGYFTQTSGVDSTKYPTGLARHARMVHKAVSGEARREVVDSAKCANCHDNFAGHGGNRVYDAQGCIVCHNPNLQESFNLKDMLHNIHSAQAIADNNSIDWSGVVFPSISPSYCIACHKPGTYSEVPVGAQPSTYAWTTVASPGVTIQTATDTLTSPFTAACISCHNTALARAHARANGGSILVLRPAYPATDTETCGICHGAGKSEDPAMIHRVLIF